MKMKIQTKRRGNLLSARKSIVEQTRLRQGFERKLYKQMVGYFSSTGRQASREIQSGRLQLKDIEQRLSQILLPHYRSVIESFANRFMFTKQENQWERIIRNYIATQGGDKITRISGTTRRRINKIISDGQVEGLGVDRIARNIRTQMSEPFTRYRSALIARTETHNASSYTNQAVAESYEVPMKKRWVSTNDDRTRSHHSAMNGVEVDLEADFEVPYKGVTYKMKHAGDPRGGPANVINWRCVILYVEPDDFVIDEDIPQDQNLPTVDALKPSTVVSQIVLTNVFARFRGKNLKDDYTKRINEDSNNVQKNIINQYRQPEINRVGDEGYYDGRNNYLVASLDPSKLQNGSTFQKNILLHEYGHHIDYVTGTDRLFWSENIKTNRDFRRAFEEDKKRLGLNKRGEAFNEKLAELRDLLFTQERVQYKKRKYLYIKTDNAFRNVGSDSLSDIIDALVKGEFRASYKTYGHKKSYWRKRDSDLSETFANLFSIYGKKEAYDLAKTLFPSTIKIFEKRLIEIENGVTEQ